MSLPRKSDYLRRSLGELCAGNVKKFVADGGPVTAILIGLSIQTTIQGQAGCKTLLCVLPSVRGPHQLEIRDPFQIAEI